MDRTIQDSVSSRDKIFLLYKIYTPRFWPTERASFSKGNRRSPGGRVIVAGR